MKQISFCASCQEEIPVDASWCQHCGATQTVDRPPRPVIVPRAITSSIQSRRPHGRRAASRGNLSSGFGSGLNAGAAFGVGVLVIVFGVPLALFALCSDRSSPPGSGTSRAEAPEDGVFALGDAIQVDHLRITVHSPKLGTVPLSDDLMGDPQVSIDEMLSIELTVENTSATKIYDYRPLGGEWLSVHRKASLRDNFGNKYKRVHFGIVTRVQGVARRVTLRPGAHIEDVLVFEAPIHRAETLRLTVPLEHMGIEMDLEVAWSARQIEMRK